MIAQTSSNNQIIIDLQHVGKVYGSGHVAVKAVDDVSLHILKGEIVAIMGPSGSGKTTLLQMIGALLKPTSGDILIRGRNIAGLPEKHLPQVRLQTFGFIFQTPNLLSALSAIQNVELVMNLRRLKDSQRKARVLLEQLGLETRLNHRPAKLSGGEQQRVAIARALANDPPILLADEPTANLDSKMGQSVMELLRDLTREKAKTILTVSHDLRIRYFADRVLWLEDGQLRVRWSDGVTIDPVCLMVVETDKTVNVAEHEGENYYFCSLECKKEFEKNPRQYQKMKASL